MWTIGNDTLKINWFYSSRLKKSIRFNQTFNQIHITAPDKFIDIDDLVRSDLEEYAKLRLKRKKITGDLRSRVKSYFDHYLSSKTIKRQFYQDDSNHVLTDYFDQLNQDYFQNRCKIESIGWSHRHTKRLLGKWCDLSKNIIISSYLNSKKIPMEVVQFIVYHEMCHQIYPPVKHQSRRSVHHKLFRSNEALFNHYSDVKKWFKSNGFVI